MGPSQHYQSLRVMWWLYNNAARDPFFSECPLRDFVVMTLPSPTCHQTLENNRVLTSRQLRLLHCFWRTGSSQLLWSRCEARFGEIPMPYGSQKKLGVFETFSFSQTIYTCSTSDVIAWIKTDIIRKKGFYLAFFRRHSNRRKRECYFVYGS